MRLGLLQLLLLLLAAQGDFLDIEEAAICSKFLLDGGSISSPPELPLSGGNWSCAVPVAVSDSGLGVNLTLQQLNLDAGLGDYLSINAGLHWDPRASAVFSWKLAKPMRLAIPNRDSFFLLLHLAPRFPEQSTDGLGFKVTYDSFDASTVAPTTPSTTTPLPQPSGKPRPSIRVYVGGSEPKKFVDKIDVFKSAVANASNVFCERINLTLSRPVLGSHVQIWDVRTCPSNWPQAELCSAVMMAVPAFATNPTDGDYELSALHMQQMWALVEKPPPDQAFLPSPWFVYRPPKPSTLAWWVAVFFGVLFLFLLLIVLAWRIEIHQSSVSTFRKPSAMNDALWPRTDVTVSSAQVQVPPYLVMEQPPEDAPSRKFYYEERNSYAHHQDGFINEAFEGEDIGDLDIVDTRNDYNYIYDNPDEEEDVYPPPKRVVSFQIAEDQSETTL